MVADFQRLVRQYAARADGARDEDHSDVESLLALLTRDQIEDHWDELTLEQRRAVAKTDDLIISLRQMVSEILPSSVPKDRSRWWWFLHEGPQVREEAEKLRQKVVA